MIPCVYIPATGVAKAASAVEWLALNRPQPDEWYEETGKGTAKL
ncbi:MAG: hypothetical protein ABGZ53_26635 [Fuerstiella sp.]